MAGDARERLESFFMVVMKGSLGSLCESVWMPNAVPQMTSIAQAPHKLGQVNQPISDVETGLSEQTFREVVTVSPMN